MFTSILSGSFTYTGVDTVKLSTHEYSNMRNTILLLEESLCETQENNCLLKEEVETLKDDFVDNLCLRDKLIKPRISLKLQDAFRAYEELCGPEIMITDLERNWNPKSAHY